MQSREAYKLLLVPPHVNPTALTFYLRLIGPVWEETPYFFQLYFALVNDSGVVYQSGNFSLERKESLPTACARDPSALGQPTGTTDGVSIYTASEFIKEVLYQYKENSCTIRYVCCENQYFCVDYLPDFAELERDEDLVAADRTNCTNLVTLY